MSTEYQVLIPNEEMILGEYVPVNYHVDMIFSSDNLVEFEGSNYPVIFEWNISDTPERIQKIHNQYEIIPIYYRIGDQTSGELDFTRETREWDVVLTFSDGSETPRRKPTELIYKGRKMKNKFTED